MKRWLAFPYVTYAGIFLFSLIFLKSAALDQG